MLSIAIDESRVVFVMIVTADILPDHVGQLQTKRLLIPPRSVSRGEQAAAVNVAGRVEHQLP
jgi:hypothetical protein